MIKYEICSKKYQSFFSKKEGKGHQAWVKEVLMIQEVNRDHLLKNNTFHPIVKN